MSTNQINKINLELIQKASKMIVDAKSLVILTGAGISTESGIPDFRTPGTGLWSKYNPDDFSHFLHEPSLFWKMIREIGPGFYKAKPNSGHEVIAELDKMGLLNGLITQNIDGLHQKAGSPIVHELHGNATEMKCIACHGRFDIEKIIKNHKSNEDHIPADCPQCGAYLTLNVVLFDQFLPRGPWLESVTLAQKADVMLVAGSSLVVYPANELPIYTLKNNGKLIIINNEETDLDSRAEILLRGQAGKILQDILKEVKNLAKESAPSKEKFKKIKFK